MSICEYTVSNKGGFPCHCHDCGRLWGLCPHALYFVGATAPTAPTAPPVPPPMFLVDGYIVLPLCIIALAFFHLPLQKEIVLLQLLFPPTFYLPSSSFYTQFFPLTTIQMCEYSCLNKHYERRVHHPSNPPTPLPCVSTSNDLTSLRMI